MIRYLPPVLPVILLATACSQDPSDTPGDTDKSDYPSASCTELAPDDCELRADCELEIDHACDVCDGGQLVCVAARAS